jgi:hypothetical protein
MRYPCSLFGRPASPWIFWSKARAVRPPVRGEPGNAHRSPQHGRSHDIMAQFSHELRNCVEFESTCAPSSRKPCTRSSGWSSGAGIT